MKKGFLDSYFKISEKNSNVRTEIGAGLTTFMTMAYILIVQPLMMKSAGMPMVEVFTVTAIVSGATTVMMGLYTNRPFALAPGMGPNAFFAFTLVVGGVLTWQQALAVNFISGVIFLALSVFGFREIIVKAIPKSIKLGIGAVVGAFLIGLGFKSAGIMSIANGDIIIGDLTSPGAITAILGIFITSILYARQVKFNMLLGIIITTLIGIPLGVTVIPETLTSAPKDFSAIAFKLDFNGLFSLKMIPIIFVFFVNDFFSTLGTLLGVSEKAGFLDENGDLPEIQKPFLVDAIGTTVGSVLGSTTITTFIESAAGVGAGGRTGLTAIVTGVLFFISLFLSPIALAIPAVATAPVLIVMGIIMLTCLKYVDYDDFTEYFPILFMIMATICTNSIADGVGAGVVSYAVVKLGAGKGKEVHFGLYILAAIMVLYYI